MCDYRVVYQDPDRLDDPVSVLAPSPRFVKYLMDGKAPRVEVYWDLQDAEQKSIDEGRHREFKHDPEMLAKIDNSPRTGPMTEQEAIEYICLKDLPRNVWQTHQASPPQPRRIRS